MELQGGEVGYENTQSKKKFGNQATDFGFPLFNQKSKS